MGEGMSLRKRAEEAARKEVARILTADESMPWDSVVLICRDSQPEESARHIANAIEAEAKRFAERALRSIYEVDDNDQIGPWDDTEGAVAERKRARGSYRVRHEFNPLETVSSIIEKRHYREEFNKMIAAAIEAAEKEQNEDK
jgi:hypothetical protein